MHGQALLTTVYENGPMSAK